MNLSKLTEALVICALVVMVALYAFNVRNDAEFRKRCKAAGGVTFISRDRVCMKSEITIDVTKGTSP